MTCVYCARCPHHTPGHAVIATHEVIWSDDDVEPTCEPHAARAQCVSEAYGFRLPVRLVVSLADRTN